MSESPQAKWYLISSITNLVHELPYELPNDLRLRILGNKEILRKISNVGVENSYQETREIGYYILKSCPILLYLFTSCQIFCQGLSKQTNVLP